MTATPSHSLSLQSRLSIAHRPSSTRRFVNLDLERSPASLHRHRVLSSARRVTALFYPDIEHRQNRHSGTPSCA